ncbi:MAG: hypothetical protein VB012_01570 [Erysipelotrichaceae bacterium]|nr:hypothetical protein [Erysipelotrichaceae bacterium]
MSRITEHYTKIFDGYLKDRVERKVSEFRIRHASKRIMEVQNELLLSSLRYAIKNCEYYKKLNISVDNPADLRKFPFLTKNLIRENNDSIISKKKNSIRFKTSYTGGSTGEPLSFLLSNSFDGLFQKLLWIKYDYIDGDIILAMDGAQIPQQQLEKGLYLYNKSVSQLPYGGYGLSSLYLTKDNIGKYWEEIECLKPAFIRGYPAFIYSLAEYVISNNVNVNWQVKAIELTSETSFEYQRQKIIQAFKTKVYLQYGHTESCVFGYTFDDSYRYRIEPLYGYVEVIKNNGNHADIGEEGEIVVTSFYNKIMPFIRYKTGDRAIFGGCDQQGLILNCIMGRTQDYIINENNDKVLLTALIFAQHFNALAHIERWQIEQFVSGRVLLHIIKTINYNSHDELELIELFRKKAGVTVEFDYCDSIPLTLRGKSMMIIQHLSV